ncbi:MAG: NAD(P)/FAD-dependent oxidoreductase [Ferrimicrobium sp.]
MSKRRLVIVGASLAGHRAARTMHQLDPDREITVLGAESHLPYQRPPLSKQFLTGRFSADRLRLRGAIDTIDLQLSTPARSLDRASGVIKTDDGSHPYDDLIIATGANPIQLPQLPQGPRTVYLRTLDDCVRLRSLIAPGRHCTIIGAGFIGLEVAATAHQLGANVTVVERTGRVLPRAGGEIAAAVIERWHRDNSIDLRFGTEVAAFDPDLGICDSTSGDRWNTDVLVVGVGVRPSVEWLEGQLALDINGGIRAGADGRVENEVSIGVAGDVASWFHPLYQRFLRFEHFDNAIGQATHLVTNLARGTATALTDIPFGWSDQFGHLIQFLGTTGPDYTEVTEEADDAGGLIITYLIDAIPVGAILIDATHQLEPTRARIQHALDVTRLDSNGPQPSSNAPI